MGNSTSSQTIIIHARGVSAICSFSFADRCAHLASSSRTWYRVDHFVGQSRLLSMPSAAMPCTARVDGAGWMPHCLPRKRSRSQVVKVSTKANYLFKQSSDLMRQLEPADTKTDVGNPDVAKNVLSAESQSKSPAIVPRRLKQAIANFAISPPSADVKKPE